MISLQTNVASLVAQQNLNVDQMFQTQTITQLTSGYRINSSGDDAAGLAVANQDKSQIAQLTQGVANGNNAVAQLQIMDGGMSNISQILDRLQTLATESASGTFTGDRTTLNNEFQTDIQEIDRQAQSIGLNTGGTFAQNLSVYLGEGSGSQSLSNAVVGLNLSPATVDSQSLGLMGFRAIAGTADLSSSSATSVANILANSNNAELVSGDATFEFSGSGFSGLQVNVNLSGVSDINSLVNNINSAIQSAASGSSAAAAAFKAAGLVASVNTAANGSEQLAFTSSTGAFQVQAGDQMANALMGNFSSGTTGASLATSVTGQVAQAGTTTLGVGQNISVQVSGSGLSSPQKITLSQGGGDTTVALAVADLEDQINNGTTAAGLAIKNAGISVTQNSAGQLVFTNANDAPFQVEAADDTGNLLGLGSSLGSSGNVQYTSITAGTAYASTGLTASAASAQTTLEFSVNGGQAIDLAPISLDAGDATASTNTSTAITSNGVVAATGANVLTFSVDGKAVTATLAANTNNGAAVVTGGAITSSDFSTTHGTLLIGYNGNTQVVTLTGNDTTVAAWQTDLQSAINTAFGAGHITVGTSGNDLTLTSTATGLNASITVGSNSGADDALATSGLSAGTTNGSGYTAGQVAAAMNTAIQNAQSAIDPTTGLTGTLYTGPGNTPLGATVTVNNSNQLVITNNNGGAGHTVSTVTGTGAAALFGGAGTTAVGTNRSLNNLVSAINIEIQNNATLTAAGLQASNNSGALEIASTNNTKFQLNAGAAFASGTATSSVDLTNGGNFATSPVTLNLMIDGTTSKSVTLNENEADASAIASAINQQLGSAATASVLQVNGKQYLQIASATSGQTSSVQVLSGSANSVLGFTAGTYSGANEANVGFGAPTGLSFAGSRGVAGASSTLSAVNAGGASQTGGMSFTALAAGDGTQALTISAVDASGVTQSATITLAATGSGTVALGNDGSASSIGNAVAYINQQLQKSNNPTLQGIVAVEQNVNGVNEINFMSPGKTFQVAIGTNADGGLNGGAAETATAQVTGQGGTISIDSQVGAEAAVTAITSAVAKLGQAQAVIGKGENQLNYAVSLANSQITNISVAESDIMDANVAQEAANLSKAQVLNQAAVAAMAQANSAPQVVLSLLRG
ncbi:MAG TPA: flagellin [Bryobacteraceae bacterium]